MTYEQFNLKQDWESAMQESGEKALWAEEQPVRHRKPGKCPGVAQSRTSDPDPGHEIQQVTGWCRWRLLP